MDGYYDYHPTHRLERPLALVGFVNALTHSVAHQLSATTGLPLAIVDELVEHHEGASMHRLIEEQGLPAWRDAEKRELSKLLRSRNPMILALGEGILADSMNLNATLTQTELVYLYLPLELACRRAARQSLRRRASLWAELDPERGDDQDALRTLFERRCFLYELAHVRVNVSGQSITEATSFLRERLPQRS